ncbi:hypothetical protein INS49_004321 [Diaporthe citri]|uniref:uncharacterized protein n=1 Tax=Diaporthe citri TaxID=83186 RepID=UPI001C7F1695|nr:uncharacterized protein INS49_004321 [Diaporthe citri]KAG6355240.1 hypothetical protein INS49_004321 [Diaporthe citri]
MEGIFDTENMADNEQPNDSPLFTKIPAELRLQIYNEIFEGSRTTYRQSLVMGHRTYRNILWPTDHRNFLLTCRQAYNEALETYWSKAILYGDHGDKELVFSLQSVVPGFAKLHIKHIRGLCALDVWEHPVRGCLHEFRGLQTVAFEYRMICNVTGLDNPPTIQEQVDEDFKDDHWRFNKLIYDGGPAVTCRVFFSRAVFEGDLFVEGEFEKDRRVFFYNCSTGKSFCADHPNKIDDEEAFLAMVLGNQAPAEKARQEI